MKAVVEHECSGHKKDGPIYSYGTCMTRATIFEDGKWWCWRHAPSRVQARTRRLQSETRHHQHPEEWEGPHTGACDECKDGFRSTPIIGGYGCACPCHIDTQEREV